MGEAKTTLELLLQWEQLLYPVLAAGVGLIVWLVRQEGRIGRLEKEFIEQHRVGSLEKRFDELHADHNNLDEKVDRIDGKLNRVVGILSMVHPEAVKALDD